jgi:uncharacterized membrane protein YdjX (TVP38/TMEM64 family)
MALDRTARRRMTRTAWIAGVALVVLVVGASFLRDALGIEWNIGSVHALVEESGLWAPLLFISLVTFRVLILVPSQILLAAAGLLFGATLGTVYGAVGMTLSGLLNFAAVRVAGIDAIRERLPGRFSGAVAVARSNVGAGALAIATGYPVGPISAFQLGAALTGMGLVSFAGAVALGATVRAATYSFLGSGLVDGERLLAGTAVLAAAAVVPLLFPRSRARLAELFNSVRAELDDGERK